jgi:hypothetical protein
VRVKLAAVTVDELGVGLLVTVAGGIEKLALLDGVGGRRAHRIQVSRRRLGYAYG